MIHNFDESSAAFRKYVSQHKAPVIMQVLPALNSGGVEQGVIDLNKAIVEAGGQSIVVSSGGKRIHEITRHGGVHIELPVHSKNPFVMSRNVRRIRRLIRDYNVDIIHACSRAPAWSAQKAVKGTTARYVTSCHAAHKITGKLKRMYNASIANGERVIAVSHFLADYLENNYEIDPQNIRVIHRGLPLEKFHPNSVTPDRLIDIAKKWRVPDGAFVITVPARLTRIKGHIHVVDALSRLKRNDIFCVFVGSSQGKDNYRQELETYIEGKGLGSSIRLVDHCDDMPSAYMISAVVLCPSIVPEGFGRIPIEAQAMGRPIIATDHGGTRETIIRDETGWLVRPESGDELAHAIAEAMAMDNKQRAILGTKAMTHVAAHFTVEKMCAATLNVYAELLNDNPMQALPSNDTLVEQGQVV